jgi:hypothetical protein
MVVELTLILNRDKSGGTGRDASWIALRKILLRRSGTCPISRRNATRLSVRKIKEFYGVTWEGDERHIAATKSTF